MAKRTQRYTTRDPKPSTRDPEITQRPVETEPQPVKRSNPPIVRVAQTKCTDCGHAGWRAAGGTAHANISTQEMFRYRWCAHCGKAHWLASPMTTAELKRYMEPARN